MNASRVARLSGCKATQPLESVAAGGSRPRLLRVVDPWDVAGHASRALLPSHATPAVAHAAYYLVLAGFVAGEVIEPPVALLLGVGHLMLQSHNRVLQEVGAAVEDGA
jgi:hypothetical protein